MSIMKHIKDYFSGEWGEPKFTNKMSTTKTQDQMVILKTEALVGQLEGVSEPTYMLAKAIDEGRVKVYYKIWSDNCCITQYGISLVFPDKKVIKGWVSRSKYHSKGGILSLPSFNSQEREYLFTSVIKAVEHNEAVNEAKEQAKRDEANAKIRNQIVQSLS